METMSARLNEVFIWPDYRLAGDYCFDHRRVKKKHCDILPISLAAFVNVGIVFLSVKLSIKYNTKPLTTKYQIYIIVLFKLVTAPDFGWRVALIIIVLFTIRNSTWLCLTLNFFNILCSPKCVYYDWIIFVGCMLSMLISNKNIVNSVDLNWLALLNT